MTLHRLTGWALEQGVPLDDLQVIRPTLEDVYLELTGSTSGADNAGEAADRPPKRRGRAGSRGDW